MGMRYSLYRLYHEFEKKSGLLKRKHRPSLYPANFVTLSEWRQNSKSFIWKSKQELNIPKILDQKLELSAKKILNGQIKFFNDTWFKLGLDYDWLTNPSNGFKYDKKHWSEISDFSSEAGDIKYVWEKSRFSYLLTLIRYDYHFDLDLSEFVLSEIESWIDSNPINLGPNWKCSQEISLRILNWCCALAYFQNSPAFTEKRWKKIQVVIYASLHHVYHHISFSRIAVRNNHAITETLFLALSNILFPYLTETKKWSNKGLIWFKKEIEYQIYEDGTFLQFSMNYHRVVIQLLSLAISMFEKNGFQLGSKVMDRAYKSINFLYQCMQDENGNLPNYGSNDGALFFPWTECDYRDYRPQLNTLHYILTGNGLYNDAQEIEEDLFWFGHISIAKKFNPIKKQIGCQSFEIGGYYICRLNNYFTFIRCGNHKDRPAQADNLHLDVWYKGENILRDSGSYKYNTDKEKTNYFMGTLSHNTVMVEDQSQMLKGGRFIWYYWTQCLEAKWVENNDAYIFKGKIKAFNHINPQGTHEREVVIYKNNPCWEVNDVIYGIDGKLKKQIWHPNSKLISIHNDENILQTFPSYNSNYYGSYTNENSLYFEFNNQISTRIQHKHQ